MYKFTEIKSAHLEITSRCQASCPMCSRNYRSGLANPNLKLTDWSFDDFKNIFTLDVLTQINNIFFCGNFGDPIINDNLPLMCNYIKNNNPQSEVRIHTNGGARKIEWWKELVNCLPNNHIVIFGIDGLDDTHHLYRVGTVYEKIIENAKAFISAGGNAEWVFIKFRHNEHQVKRAEELAYQYGFKRFVVKNSTRFLEPKFDVLDNKGSILYQLEPPSDNAMVLLDDKILEDYRSWVNKSTIQCYVQHNKEIYIDAHRNLFPCCFLASIPYNYTKASPIVENIKKEMKNQYDQLISDFGGIEKLNLNNYSIKSIIETSNWQNLWNKYWHTEKLITCVRNCGVSPTVNVSKPKDQFVKRINF